MKSKNKSKNKNKKPNPVCALWWRDAAYVFQRDLPSEIPPLNVTVGFIVEANDEFTHIVTDAKYNEETGYIGPDRGVLIPERAIAKFKVIGNLHEKEE